LRSLADCTHFGKP